MKVFDFFFAARPLLHLPVWSVYLVCLYYHHQLSGKTFSSDNIMVMIGMSLIVSGAYYINQIFDYDSDKINKKLGFLQNKILSFRQLKIAYYVVSLIPIALSFFYSKVLFIIFVQFYLLGLIYSSELMRLKDKPISGLFVNAYSFGWLVPFTVMPEINFHNAGLLGWDNPFYFFLAVASIHILTTIPDKEGDIITGKKTIAVIMSDRTAKALALAFMVASVAVAFNSGFNFLLLISVVSSFFILLTLIIKSDRLCLFTIKLPILLLTFLAGYFFWGYFLFIVVLLISSRIYYKKRFGIKYPQVA